MKGRKKTLEALSKFSREGELSPHEADRFAKTLFDGDDRTIALLAATTLERSLHNLLLAGMRQTNSEQRGLLFSDRRPLSNFAAKIWVAFAFNLIEEDVARKLDHVRAIRNAFAHALRPIDFATPEVSDATNLLGIDSVGPAPAASRERFMFAFARLMRELAEAARRPHQRRYTSRLAKALSQSRE